MSIRRPVIAVVVAGIVVLGGGASANALTGARHQGEPSSGTSSDPAVMVVNVYGDNNTIAADRSVIAAGDHTRLNANAGDVASSGTLGIDSKNSALASGTSSSGGGGKSLPVPGDGQGTAISGYEDHSVRVSGEDEIGVYDDSNLFIGRNGLVNANTGDTDSSGLNVVDASGSTVTSGDHTEDGRTGAEEARQAAGAPRNAVPAAQVGASGGKTPSRAEKAAPVSRTRTPLPIGPQGNSAGQAGSTVTDEGESSATGKSSFTIGADGYDNLGIELQGKRNLVTYDDSNVVIGGTGNANAQIGDSDTSGAVAMGVHDSHIRSGNST